MKVIMYHYVRPASQTGVYAFLRKEDFIEQIRFFQKFSHVLGRNEFCEKLASNSFHAKDVLLTFDDGLMDHYDHVYPVLRTLGMTGIFYISTGSLTQKKILDVHLAHCLLATAPATVLIEKLLPLLVPEMFTHAQDTAGSMMGTHRYATQDSAEAVRTFKKLFNYYIQPHYRTPILRTVAQELVDEKELFDQFYIKSEQLREMHGNGMFIGSHGVSHTLLGPLPCEEQQKEIVDSFAVLDYYGLIDSGLKMFCYPYGGDGSFSNATFSILAKEDVRLSVNVEARDCTPEDIAVKYLVPRYDCNLFPYGVATVIAH